MLYRQLKSSGKSEYAHVANISDTILPQCYEFNIKNEINMQNFPHC